MNLGLGQNLNKLGFLNGLFNKNNPFLDATVAYSLRDLGLGAAHVVKVRRSSDNLEQDFTATEIIDGTLTAFCGAGDGFVSVWYDQTGVYNATQITSTVQPQIVNTGALILEGDNPTLKFSGSFLQKTDFILTQPTSIFCVAKSNTIAAPKILLDSSSTSNRIVLYYPGSGSGFAIFSGVVVTAGDRNINQNLWSAIFDSPSSSLDINNISIITNSNSGSQNFDGLTVGNDLANNFWDGNIQEIVIFNLNKSEEKSNINLNINSHYNIYP